MTGESERHDPVRAALVAAASRGEHRRLRARRRQLLGGLAAGIMVAGLSATFVLTVNEQPSAAVEIVETETGVRFSWTTDDIDPRIDAAAREYGLDVTIEHVPVGPSQVGRVAGFRTTDPSTVVQVGHNRRSVDISGPVSPVTLSVGRTADRDERYASPSDAFARDEPLECLELVSRTPEIVAETVEQLGIEVRWQPTGDTSSPLGEPVDTATILDSEFATYRLGAALMTSAQSMLVYLTADGMPPSPHLTPAECER